MSNIIICLPACLTHNKLAYFFLPFLGCGRSARPPQAAPPAPAGAAAGAAAAPPPLRRGGGAEQLRHLLEDKSINACTDNVYSSSFS